MFHEIFNHESSHNSQSSFLQNFIMLPSIGKTHCQLHAHTYF